MAEFASRLRGTAKRDGYLNGADLPSQQRDVFFAFLRALPPVLDSLGSVREAQPSAEALREPLYLFALFCALSGVEVVPALEADLTHRELTVARAKPGEAAPIPDGEGIFRDPATKRAVTLG